MKYGKSYTLRAWPIMALDLPQVAVLAALFAVNGAAVFNNNDRPYALSFTIGGGVKMPSVLL